MRTHGKLCMVMYHLELRQFPHVARVFNLDLDELQSRFLIPWGRGTMIDHDDRRWAPERTKLKVLEGPELQAAEMGMGRGWARASATGQDVTDLLLEQSRRGAQARPEIEALKEAIVGVASGEISFQDVVALAAAGHPAWRVSEQLELSEQAVWEMLHQGRLEIVTDGGWVTADQWLPIVMSWATWIGEREPAMRLRVPASPA